MTIRRTLTACLIAGAALAVTPGCLISTSSRVSYTGRYVSPETLDRIIPGTSTTDDVRTLLGEPTGTQTAADGTETWKWSYRKAKTSSGAVFLLFASRSETAVDGATLVRFRDGVATKRWQE
jgi:outer membrane protein assembly factor BamE (lipoprotein component of BamABCDE complex)